MHEPLSSPKACRVTAHAPIDEKLKIKKQDREQNINQCKK